MLGPQTFAAHLVEVEEIEEVHRAEHEHHDAELGAEEFNHRLRAGGFLAITQGHGDEPDVDQVESDDEQVVDRVGHGVVAAKGLHEEDAAVAVERSRDPDGHGDGDREIEEVGGDGVVHGLRG